MSFAYENFFTSELAQLKQQGNYRNFATIERDVANYPHAQFHGGENAQKATIWCSNDYLAMSRNVEVQNAFQQAAATYGVGSGGTRNISGTSLMHARLETAVAAWHKKESALIFSSAYVANMTTLATLGRKIPDLIFLSDERNHASLIEGMRHTKCDKVIFKHNSTNDLRKHLKALDPKRPKMIVFESVYSMSGHTAPINEFCDLAQEFGAMTYLDEVHAVGLYGERGSGLAEEQNATHRLDFINGTFSKAIGCFGGYVAGSCAAVDFVRSFGSGFIFTTSLPPAVCAAIHASIGFIERNPLMREEYFVRIRLLKDKLTKAGIPFRKNDSHVISVTIGDPVMCKQITDTLLKDYGIYAQPINYPTVPWGEECLRLTLNPLHSDADMDHLVDSLYHVIPQILHTTPQERAA